MSRMTPTDLKLKPPRPIAARLEQALGLGTNPELRRALYVKLEALVNGEKGSEVLEVLDAVVNDAMSKTEPGRYFAYVATRRLQERGLMTDRERVAW